MINFIIYSDEFSIYKREIDNFMMKYDIGYNCYIYNDTKGWADYLKSIHGFKVILIDTKNNPKINWVSLVQTIRKELDDWNSMIIVVPDNIEYKNIIIHRRLMILDFLEKSSNWLKEFREMLRICLKHFDNRPKLLKYNYKGVFYNLDFQNIIYIEKELDSKRCLIYTTKEIYPYQGTINNLLELLDNRFIKSSRSVIINLDKINSYNTKNNILYFCNGKSINAISRDKKKDIIRHVRGLE